MSHNAHRLRHHPREFDAQMLQVSERLMEEFDELPLLAIIRAINDARRTTTDWIGRVEPAAVYRLAAWNLAESRIATLA